ncbi:hypothetical protein CKAH01_01499 [Colletotrichum kahawae]|uniref:Uncharacterized protein n=1 Tax=Colletotrichum kahawae TaxID=34407 RepID=A0AAE0D2J0_COLKA|nr:hypothetical protein CKAH01_01499 [Colletotrichum kahawae]
MGREGAGVPCWRAAAYATWVKAKAVRQWKTGPKFPSHWFIWFLAQDQLADQCDENAGDSALLGSRRYTLDGKTNNRRQTTDDSSQDGAASLGFLRLPGC